MTRDLGTRRPPPEPAICPNGHPNRPGTRICAVCRALIPPPAAAPVAARPAPAPAEPADPPPPAAPRPSRAAYWALGLVLLLLALALALFALYSPIRRRFDYLATAAVVTLPGVAAVASPTPAPPTATPPPPAATAPPPATADPNAAPTAVATITPLSTILGVILPPTAPAASATPALGPNLIQNGDFSADWVNGWERTAEDVGGVQAVEVRPPSGDPPLPALFMSKSGAGALRLSQSITLAEPADGLVFRARLQLAGATAAAEGRSALLLIYEDADGQQLGASLWLDGSAATSGLWGHGLPPFGPALAPRVQPAGWQTIEVALAHEFTDRLPDLDPAAVRRVTVVLALAGSAGCPPDACVAELSAAGLSLAAAGPRP